MMGDFTVSGSTHQRKLLHTLNKASLRSGIHRMRVATGSRLNRAEDGPAAFIFASRLYGDIRGQGQALVNIGDAKSMLTVAEDSLETIMDVLMEMKELTIAAANVQEDASAAPQNGGNGNGNGGGGGNGNGNGNGGAVTTEDTLRDMYKSRLDGLAAELDTIVSETKFNDHELLSGTGSAFNFLVNITANDTFAISIASVNADVLDVAPENIDVTSSASANATLALIDAAVSTVSQQLGGLGDVQKRLSFKFENLTTTNHNYQAAYSRIVDADLAREQMALARLDIVEQAGYAMLSQANVSSRNVLKLIEPPSPQAGARIYSIDDARNSDQHSAVARFRFAHLQRTGAGGYSGNAS